MTKETESIGALDVRVPTLLPGSLNLILYPAGLNGSRIAVEYQARLPESVVVYDLPTPVYLSNTDRSQIRRFMEELRTTLLLLPGPIAKVPATLRHVPSPVAEWVATAWEMMPGGRLRCFKHRTALAGGDWPMSAVLKGVNDDNA